MTDQLVSEKIGSTLWLKMNRPERKNALSWQMLEGISAGLDLAAADNSIRSVVLTGGVGNSFCSGVDLARMGDSDGFLDSHRNRGFLVKLFRKMWELPKPIIAEVDGYALAGGFGLACACDIVVASETAQFGVPEVSVGVWPFIITVPLLRVASPRLVLELMMTGRRMGASEAVQAGFINQAVPADVLRDKVESIASQISSKSLATLELGKSSFYNILSGGSQLELSYLHAMLGLINQTDDSKEGITAFAERRNPNWSDS
ncbi:MAG: crotonase [Acidimicrobiaceae bacterium]|nr:crotonase [Acidimicrobiaceae bacterium]